MNDLDRHRSTQRDLFGAVYPPHSAHADEMSDAVAARQHLTNEKVVSRLLRAPAELPSTSKTETMARLARSGAAGAKQHLGRRFTQGRARRKASCQAGAEMRRAASGSRWPKQLRSP